MAGERREVPSRDDVEAPETPKNNDDTLTTKFRRFVTSLPGFLTGLAAVITATATIVGVLAHGSHPTPNRVSASSAPAAPSSVNASSANANASTPPPASASNASASGAKLEWTGSLLITNDGTDLTSVPPVSDAKNDTTGIAVVYSVGNGIAPLWGTQLAVWKGNSMPTPQQCISLDTSQSSGGDVLVAVGSTVCALIANGPAGPLAIIHITGIDESNITTETQTSLYTLSGS
ncbi:MAG TPA: hypothetical protein VNV62_25720 [Trebonia sp.]|jgi:hypothetical protein|nr:hypothetical protein [Trebonia sp.]